MTTTEPRKAWTPDERSRVAAAAARASIAMRERDGDEVPQWLRDVAAGKPISKADAHS
ncbi:hypothetical protein [Rhodococcus sp. UNC23MFCrub1.1]|uniref:hypothetical protein n=1 Tax=Rhodococcus sp. UNC23MFCrub1.1 TaxID=1449068 RepID=UPI000B1B7C82|nr:hypothetical protein [Rhodococcus sp. UNC23MFCrub1.1]